MHAFVFAPEAHETKYYPNTTCKALFTIKTNLMKKIHHTVIMVLYIFVVVFQ